MFVYLGGGGGIQCIAQHPWNACGLALTGCPLVTLFELVDHQAWAHPCLVGASLLYMVVPLTATKTCNAFSSGVNFRRIRQDRYQ